MPEYYTNTASTTVSSTYTTGAGTITVGTTGGNFPANPSFRLVVADQITGLPKVLFKVTSIPSSTTFLVTPEGTDFACASGDKVFGVVTQGALDQIRQDVSQAGADASLPGTASQSTGNLYFATDLPKVHRFNGTSWITMGTDLIATTSLAANTATISLSTSIPQVFTNLVLMCYGRVTGATGPVFIELLFNGDTGNNYSWQYLYGSNTGAIAGQSIGAAPTVAGCILFNGTGAAANSPGMSVVNIPFYTGTTFYKTAWSQNMDRDASNVFRAGLIGYSWLNTTNITSITLVAASGTMIAGSQFSLYGAL